MNNLISYFKTQAEQNKSPIIELQDYMYRPVGALYLHSLDCNKMVISETTGLEKYYLYINGVGIYFSYYRLV